MKRERIAQKQFKAPRLRMPNLDTEAHEIDMPLCFKCGRPVDGVQIAEAADHLCFDYTFWCHETKQVIRVGLHYLEDFGHHNGDFHTVFIRDDDMLCLL